MMKEAKHPVRTALLTLLREELCTAPDQRKTKDALPDIDRSALYALAKAHDLAHVVGQALGRLGLLGEDELSAKLKKQQLLALYRYEQNRYALETLCRVLEEEEIPHIPLKGAVIRDYYPEPWMRTSCDIDLLIHKSDLNRAVEVLEKRLAYTIGQKNSHDLAVFAPNGVHVELHFSLMDQEDSVNRILLEAIWKTATPEQEHRYRMRMSHELFVAYSLAHMAKHFLLGGCGARSFLDLWMAKHRMGYDATEVRRLLAQCNLTSFADAAMQLSEIWFSDATHTELTRKIEEYILDAGIYGTLENRVAIAQPQSGGKFRYARKRIFLPYADLKVYYTRLERAPILYPYYQVKRWCRILFSRNKHLAIRELQYNQSISETKKQALRALCEALGLTGNEA